jgi:hypothetical protein
VFSKHLVQQPLVYQRFAEMSGTPFARHAFFKALSFFKAQAFFKAGLTYFFLNLFSNS